MQTPEEFRQAIESFLARSGMSATRFGVLAVRDPKFVFDVRLGREPSLGLANKVLLFMQAIDALPDQRAAS